MITFDRLWGVDYGSKMAGTTVICYYQDLAIYFRQSGKNEDADQMILKLIAEKNPSLIMIDAPLSLPRVYLNSSNGPGDFFYRECDRKLGAMSPMFLGGLTARAMQLKQKVAEKKIELLETYPKVQAHQLGYHDYKVLNLGNLAESIASKYSLVLGQEVQNIHQLDALLAFVGGIHYLKNSHKEFGQKEEGTIII